MKDSTAPTTEQVAEAIHEAASWWPTPLGREEARDLATAVQALYAPLVAGSTHAVLNEVRAERARQDEKWGEQNHPDGTGPEVRWLSRMKTRANALTIAWAAKDTVDTRAKAGHVFYLDILLEEVAEAFAEADPAKLRAELIQVAAVAVAWVEAIDRRAALADPDDTGHPDTEEGR